jgi:hypothetical protein
MNCKCVQEVTAMVRERHGPTATVETTLWVIGGNVREVFPPVLFSCAKLDKHGKPTKRRLHFNIEFNYCPICWKATR